jgi:hypothetical protein
LIGAIRAGLFGGPRQCRRARADHWIARGDPRGQQRIERVAVTDFAVLIKGGIDPQPHPGSIDLSGPATGEWDGGEVA